MSEHMALTTPIPLTIVRDDQLLVTIPSGGQLMCSFATLKMLACGSGGYALLLISHEDLWPPADHLTMSSPKPVTRYMALANRWPGPNELLLFHRLMSGDTYYMRGGEIRHCKIEGVRKEGEGYHFTKVTHTPMAPAGPPPLDTTEGIRIMPDMDYWTSATTKHDNVLRAYRAGDEWLVARGKEQRSRHPDLHVALRDCLHRERSHQLLKEGWTTIAVCEQAGRTHVTGQRGLYDNFSFSVLGTAHIGVSPKGYVTQLL